MKAQSLIVTDCEYRSLASTGRCMFNTNTLHPDMHTVDRVKHKSGSGLDVSTLVVQLGESQKHCLCHLLYTRKFHAVSLREKHCIE